MEPTVNCRRSGFTLMEVAIALAVMTLGLSAFGYALDGYNRLRLRERAQVLLLESSANQMELLVKSPPACRDNSFVRSVDAPVPMEISVTLKAVPGLTPVAWAWVRGRSLLQITANSQIDFRRLVPCVKNPASH